MCSKSLMGEFLRLNPQQANVGDTSDMPYIPLSLLFEMQVQLSEVQSQVIEASEELFRRNLAFVNAIMEMGQDIYDAQGTLIFRTYDVGFVCEVLDALNERHFGPTLTGNRLTPR